MFLRQIIGSLSLAALLTTSVYADPPDHAPAHGWRKKHDHDEHEHEEHGRPHYVGYTGGVWEHDYGVIEGHCDRKVVGTVVGGVVGGVIGSQVGEGDNRTVAIIVGSVLGAVVGRQIGRELDNSDRACIGHALELAKPGQSVRWINDATGVNYVVTPLAAPDKNNPCREFRFIATSGKKKEDSKQRACRKGDGAWTISPL